jgi:cytochrome c-550 PedF
MKMKFIGASVALTLGGSFVFAHGDMAPQSVDTSALPDLPEEMATENPWRDAEGELLFEAVEVGAKGYNSNCARCHGLEVISGGLAPDLRYLEANDWGDEWYLARVLNGYEQNGAVKMPGYSDILDQEAIWAIRLYIETRPDDQELAQRSDEIRDLYERVVALQPGDDTTALTQELDTIGDTFEALSGADKTVTVLDEAAYLLRADPPRISTAGAKIAGVLRD